MYTNIKALGHVVSIKDHRNSHISSILITLQDTTICIIFHMTLIAGEVFNTYTTNKHI